MTLYRTTVLDTPVSPFDGGTLRADVDAGVLVRDGVLVARGPYAVLARHHPDETSVTLDGLLLPGFVDTHVHFPQVRVIGGLGMPLLEWLERCALPEEARLADVGYARTVAAEFVSGLLDAGTTSALVFGAHFAPAVDELFGAAARAGLRITAGLVVADQLLREELHTTPARALAESLTLAGRWHDVDRARYAVTPRFSLSSTEQLLAACAETLALVEGAFLTSHVNENPLEVQAVRELFGVEHYCDTYDRGGLLGPRTVLAHNVHAADAELALLAERGTVVAHCPTSNASLGSGLFPMARHLAHGVRVALGSDVGGGTGFSLVKEGLQAYFLQQLLGPDGVPLSPAHLLYLATTAGAEALDLPVGHLSVGRPFDAQHLLPRPGSTLDVAWTHARDADDVLAKTFALATTADVAEVWIAGEQVRGTR